MEQENDVIKTSRHKRSRERGGGEKFLQNSQVQFLEFTQQFTNIIIPVLWISESLFLSPKTPGTRYIHGANICKYICTENAENIVINMKNTFQIIETVAHYVIWLFLNLLCKSGWPQTNRNTTTFASCVQRLKTCMTISNLDSF